MRKLSLMKIVPTLLLLLSATIIPAQSNKNKPIQSVDNNFESFKLRFLDSFWKMNSSYAIYAGYGKYYEKLDAPDSTYWSRQVNFSKQWLDSLRSLRFRELNENNQISYKIIQNQLKSNIWYIDTFKSQQWDPSNYNIGGECYTLISSAYAPLDERLKTLSKHLQHAEAFYTAALQTLVHPTKELTELAIMQNEGSLSVFGNELTDSIKSSHLSTAEKDTLEKRISVAKSAITDYVDALKKLIADKSYSFRDFRIGEKLFNQKFKYDLVTDQTAREIFNKAVASKRSYHKQMFSLANQLWTKYCPDLDKPTDSAKLIKTVIDKISIHHLAPKDLFDSLNKQMYELKKFIIKKDLFDFDTTAPIVVRKMPAYAMGLTLASAEFPSPYQTSSVAYYNISDLSMMQPAKAESQLRENNDYILQILTIHEGMPGHCLQGIYNRKSPDIIKAVFTNSTMSEGWAVYCERMMLENGWANNSPEMWLMFYKWSLRECCNVIVDYGIHCLHYSKDEIVKLLKNEAFQEDAQIEEKYHRATVSQVQLCSYFTGGNEIFALREAYKKKMGSGYTLKDFHEKFLSYGTSPVKFIREAMLKGK